MMGWVWLNKCVFKCRLKVAVLVSQSLMSCGRVFQKEGAVTENARPAISIWVRKISHSDYTFISFTHCKACHITVCYLSRTLCELQTPLTQERCLMQWEISSVCATCTLRLNAKLAAVLTACCWRTLPYTSHVCWGWIFNFYTRFGLSDSVSVLMLSFGWQEGI